MPQSMSEHSGVHETAAILITDVSGCKAVFRPFVDRSAGKVWKGLLFG
jgi:hypothetical protein